MKTEVKKKCDIRATANKTVKYKDWEKLFLDLLEADKNPVFKKCLNKSAW